MTIQLTEQSERKLISELIPSERWTNFGHEGYQNMWRVYILQCSDGSYYTGISGNVFSRVEEHNNGRGSKYTKARRPVSLKYFEEVCAESLAMQREKEIKSFSNSNKERLIRCGSGRRVSLATDV